MHLQNYVLVSGAYDAWKRGDIEAFGQHLAEDIEFAVPSATSTFLGAGTGREELKRRLRAFLESYEVRRFDLLTASPADKQCVFRIEYDYRSRETGLEIVGTQRHIWGVKDNLIVSFVVAHDAHRLGAYFDLTRPHHQPVVHGREGSCA